MPTGIKINMTEKEASSEALDATPLPAGKYLVAVTDVELKQVTKEGANKGKPFYNMEFTVQDGEHEGRKIFTNVMLFSPALYSLVQLLKALGVHVDSQTKSFQVEDYDVNEVPDGDWFLGQDFVVRIVVQPKRTDEETGKEYEPRNEVKGYFNRNTWKGAPAAVAQAKTSKQASLLP